MKIDGVLHEFSTVKDVVEDVPEIIVNLKGVNLEEAKKVKEQLFINTKIPLKKGDILRRKIEN